MKKWWISGLFVLICLFIGLKANAFAVIEQGSFRLYARSEWSTAEKKNYARLTWDKVANLSQAGFQLYQSEDRQKWENRSMKYGKKIKVLNVYPNREDSNTLKDWMDSLNLKAENNEKLIEVTAVTLNNYNKNAATILKQKENFIYDVIMFGSWDSNDWQPLSLTGANLTSEFIDSGRGILFGHDTTAGFERLGEFKRFVEPSGLKPEEDRNRWTGSTKVKLIDDGYLMKYPFEMKNGQILTIPYAHNISTSIKNVGKVWAEFIDPEGGWPYPIFDNGIVRGGFYLKTNNNLAMIQTGHSNGDSTLDERRIIANTLYNLAQVSLDTSLDDYSVKDTVEPEKPVVSVVSGGSYRDFKLKATAQDLGKKYWWYIEADTKNQGVRKSDVVQEEIKSDLQGYIYTINAQKNFEPAAEKDEYGNVRNLTQTVEAEKKREIEIAVKNQDSENLYLHIRAVDRANNVGPVRHVALQELVPELKISESYLDDTQKVIQNPTETYRKRGANFQKEIPALKRYDLTAYQIGNQAKVAVKNGAQIQLNNLQSNQKIRYFYQLKVYPVQIQHLDDSGKQIAAPQNTQVKDGSSYRYPLPQLEGHRFAGYKQLEKPASTTIKEENGLVLSAVTGPITLQLTYQRTITVHYRTEVAKKANQKVLFAQLPLLLQLIEGTKQQSLVVNERLDSTKNFQSVTFDRKSDQFAVSLQTAIPEYYQLDRWYWGNNAQDLREESKAALVTIPEKSQIWLKRVLYPLEKPKRYSWVMRESLSPIFK